MATMEVFTVGGGDYLVNTFNAVAAWTGEGGYKSMIQCVMVMSFGMATMVVAFNLDWRAWINWFLQATLMYMCLMVPRIDIQVTDRVNPSLTAAHVANVPIGLGALASFTSQMGDYLVTSAETVFGMPDDLNYSRNDMIYGSRLLEATQGVSINDPEFAANLDNHYRQCVFYDILLGHKSMATLANADDLWAALGPGSPARSQPYLVRDAGGTVTSSIKTCREAYADLTTQWNTVNDGMLTILGKRLYPGMTDTLAKAKLYADLPVAYDYLTGVSKGASDLMKQTLAINAMTQAMHTMSGSTGGSSVDVYAETRADIQTRNTYAAISHSAMEWVPILNIVLTVVFYALFPILFPLFLIPRTGPGALKGYITGFFYLAAWGPLYVILNMIVMLKEHTQLFHGASVSLVTFGDIQSVNQHTGELAGYLIASVPFIAAGMARGAMAISGSATSFLAPSQNAAEEAAREASTGNVSLGNTSLDNYSYNGRQGNAWHTAPNLMGGAGVISTVDAYGSVQSQFAGGTSAVDMHQGISTLPSNFQLTQAVDASVERAAGTMISRADRLSDQARESASNTVTSFNELKNGFQTSHGIETGYGTNDQSVMQEGFSQVDQVAAGLKNHFGLSDSAAHEAATRKYLGVDGDIHGSGDLGVGTGAGGAKAGMGVGLKGSAGASRNWSDNDIKTYTRNADRIADYLNQQSHDRKWSNSSDAFERAAVNTSSASLSSSAHGMISNLSKARSFDREASHSYEVAHQLQERTSLRDSQGMSISDNMNSDWIEWSSRHIANNAGLYPMGHRFDPRKISDYNSDDPIIAGQYAILRAKYVEEKTADVVKETEASLVAPSSDGIVGPSFSSVSGVGGGSTLGESKPLANEHSGEDSIRRNVVSRQQDVRRHEVGGEHHISDGLGHIAALNQTVGGEDDFKDHVKTEVNPHIPRK
ncbi:conjugal transfer protein TraG N-terminal domain-containing protein [Sphingomonas oryzagri]